MTTMSASHTTATAPPAVPAQRKSNAQKFAEAEAKYADRLDSLTMRERCLWGLSYDCSDPPLEAGRIRAHNLNKEYNRTKCGPENEGEEGASDKTNARRRELLREMLGVSEEAVQKILIEPPFYCDYGTNIKFEGRFFSHFNTSILDCAEVIFGDGVLLGPNVHIYAATHSISVTERESMLDRSLPVAIGRNTFVGGNTSIVAGVTIGQGCTIGAGSTVTRDIPDWSVAAGCPAQVIRTLTESERGKKAS